MNLKLLENLGKVAGIGGIALGVLVYLLKEVLANNVFQALPLERDYTLLLLITVGAFAMGALGILASIIAKRSKTSQGSKVHAEGGSAAFSDQATSNTITINNTKAKREDDAGS